MRRLGNHQCASEICFTTPGTRTVGASKIIWLNSRDACILGFESLDYSKHHRGESVSSFPKRPPPRRGIPRNLLCSFDFPGVPPGLHLSSLRWSVAADAEPSAPGDHGRHPHLSRRGNVDRGAHPRRKNSRAVVPSQRDCQCAWGGPRTWRTSP